jgi:hypothetical protein
VPVDAEAGCGVVAAPLEVPLGPAGVCWEAAPALICTNMTTQALPGKLSYRLHVSSCVEGSSESKC